MKNLITATACTMLLLAFLVEFVHSQMVFQQIMEVEYRLKLFEENLDHGTQLSNEDVIAMQRAVSDIMGCGENEVQIDGFQNGMQYQISFPIANVFAMADFWGLDPDENRKFYVIRRKL